MIRHFFRTFLNKVRDLFSSRKQSYDIKERAHGSVPEIHLDPIIARAHRVRVPKVLRRIRMHQGMTTGDY